MKIVSTGYSKTKEFYDPVKWLEKISFYAGLLEELAKHHHVTSIERIDYEGQLNQHGVNYHFINLSKNIVRFPHRMHEHIKHLEPDIVFVNGFIFPLQIIQLRMKLGKNVKIIVLHRSEKPASGLKRWLQKIADKKVDAYLFSSNEFGKDWTGIINEGKIYEVNQASSSFKPANKIEARNILSIKTSPVFIWVGNLDKNKDPLTLISAFKEYLAFQPQAALHIIHQSDDLLNDCKELMGTNENIKLVGKIENRQMENWYSAADFFISTSHYEGNGIAALEAMSCGCIPVLSNINSFRRMADDGKYGLLFEPGNAVDLLKALLKTNNLNKEEEKKRLLRHFNNELSFEAIARKIEVVISTLKND